MKPWLLRCSLAESNLSSSRSSLLRGGSFIRAARWPFLFRRQIRGRRVAGTMDFAGRDSRATKKNKSRSVSLSMMTACSLATAPTCTTWHALPSRTRMFCHRIIYIFSNGAAFNSLSVHSRGTTTLFCYFQSLEAFFSNKRVGGDEKESHRQIRLDRLKV